MYPDRTLGVVLGRVLRCLAKECRPDPLCPGRPGGPSDRSGAEPRARLSGSTGERPLPDHDLPARAPGRDAPATSLTSEFPSSVNAVNSAPYREHLRIAAAGDERQERWRAFDARRARSPSNGGGEQTCDVHQSPAAPLTPRHRTKDSKAGLNCFEGTLRGSSPDRTTSGGSYGLPVPMSS